MATLSTNNITVAFFLANKVKEKKFYYVYCFLIRKKKPSKQFKWHWSFKYRFMLQEIISNFLKLENKTVNAGGQTLSWIYNKFSVFWRIKLSAVVLRLKTVMKVIEKAVRLFQRWIRKHKTLTVFHSSILQDFSSYKENFL